MCCSCIAMELKCEVDLFQIQCLILLQWGWKKTKQLMWFLPLLQKSLKQWLSHFVGKREKHWCQTAKDDKYLQSEYGGFKRMD